MILALVAALVLPSYSPTAQAQALAVVGSPPALARVVRINVAGRYAVVLTKGGRMEGSSVSAPVLLERFSFGWQALDLLNTRCVLASQHLSEHVEETLMRGMPHVTNGASREPLLGDSGPGRDVEAIRATMRGPLVPYVLVSREWALGMWYGAGGGQVLYRKTRGTWHRVAGGGGAMDFATVRAFGVPYRDACAFHLLHSTCR